MAQAPLGAQVSQPIPLRAAARQDGLELISRDGRAKGVYEALGVLALLIA